MSDDKTKQHDETLDAFFEAARVAAPQPSPDLLARIAAAAEAEASKAVPVGRANGPKGVRAFLAAIGGWPALAGIATAAVAGLMIGYAAPGVSGFATVGEAGTYDVGSLLPGYAFFEDESG